MRKKKTSKRKGQKELQDQKKSTKKRKRKLERKEKEKRTFGNVN